MINPDTKGAAAFVYTEFGRLGLLLPEHELVTKAVELALEDDREGITGSLSANSVYHAIVLRLSSFNANWERELSPEALQDEMVRLLKRFEDPERSGVISAMARILTSWGDAAAERRRQTSVRAKRLRGL